MGTDGINPLCGTVHGDSGKERKDPSFLDCNLQSVQF